MIIILDNAQVAKAPVSDLIGKRKFGDVVFKRQKLINWQINVLSQLLPDVTIKISESESDQSLILSELQDETPVFFMPASLWIRDAAKFKSIFVRARLGRLACLIKCDFGSAAFFPTTPTEGLLRDFMSSRDDTEEARRVVIDGREALIDLTDYRNCLDVLSGAFEARHFNSITVNPLTLKKRSGNKEKIRSEHDYWHLLPARLKRWVVMPFNYTEGADFAEYEMERLSIADLALQWVHGAISPEELRSLLNILDAYLAERPRRSIEGPVATLNFNRLFRDKVISRYEALKALEIYPNLNSWVATGTKYSGIDEVMKMYFMALDKVLGKLKIGTTEVIGHGDLCFSNILYERHGRVLKLVDPKGASNPDELWGDPRYDVVKLSHSLLGDYDFINGGLFKIQIDAKNSLKLQIGSDRLSLNALKAVFISWLGRQGIGYETIRVLEASLFLSMLPLHADHPNKVLALLLNAIDIIEEVSDASK